MMNSEKIFKFSKYVKDKWINLFFGKNSRPNKNFVDAKNRCSFEKKQKCDEIFLQSKSMSQRS
jgi:hypothetical protein